MGAAIFDTVNSAVLRAIAGIICMAALTHLAPASAQEATVVVLGDSNAQGYGVNPQDAFPARLEALLRRSGRPVHVVNAGVMGDTLGGLLARVDSQVPSGTRLV